MLFSCLFPCLYLSPLFCVWSCRPFDTVLFWFVSLIYDVGIFFCFYLQRVSWLILGQRSVRPLQKSHLSGIDTGLSIGGLMKILTGTLRCRIWLPNWIPTTKDYSIETLNQPDQIYIRRICEKKIFLLPWIRLRNQQRAISHAFYLLTALSKGWKSDAESISDDLIQQLLGSQASTLSDFGDWSM